MFSPEAPRVGHTKRRIQAGEQTRKHENGAWPGGGAPYEYGARGAAKAGRGQVYFLLRSRWVTLRSVMVSFAERTCTRWFSM